MLDSELIQCMIYTDIEDVKEYSYTFWALLWNLCFIYVRDMFKICAVSIIMAETGSGCKIKDNSKQNYSSV